MLCVLLLALFNSDSGIASSISDNSELVVVISFILVLLLQPAQVNQLA